MAKTCNSCGEDMSMVTMSGANWEANEERHRKRENSFFAVIVLLILLLVATNIGWLWYESQFETVEETTTTITQENLDGYNNYIGNDGDILNGEADNNN